MTNLERELRDLAPFVELPVERDLAPAVRERIGDRRRSRARPLVLAVALLVVAIAIAFAVPPARSAILRWFGIGNARIEFVDRLPDIPVQRSLDLGARTSLVKARRSVAYPILTSKLLGPANEVRLLGDQVGFVYDDKLIVTQSRGTFFTKETGPGTRVEQLRFDGLPAVWISGARHLFGYIGGNASPPRPVELSLAGNVLIWQAGELTLRLEGKVSRDEALEIARSFR
jgi:hypothetical protein